MRKSRSALTLTSLIAAFILAPVMAMAAPQSYKVSMDGMTCADCAQAISMALAKIPNIDKSSVKVTLKGQTATLKMNDADKNTQDLVKKAVEDSGYTVKKIEVIPMAKS